MHNIFKNYTCGGGKERISTRLSFTPLQGEGQSNPACDGSTELPFCCWLCCSVMGTERKLHVLKWKCQSDITEQLSLQGHPHSTGVLRFAPSVGLALASNATGAVGWEASRFAVVSDPLGILTA